MRTLTEKYNGVLKGLFSKDQFLRDARMEQPNLVTQHNSYQDAVSILTRRGLISEIVNEVGSKDIEYRGCIIEPDDYGDGFTWHRPGWVDSKDEGGYSWAGWGSTVEDCKDDIDEEYEEYHEMGGTEIEEKKLTPAEKAGKEKIIKGLKKSGMSKDDPSTYAIATAKAKELYEEEEEEVVEGAQEVNSAVGDVLDLVKHHAKSLSDDDAFEFHETLKRWFNRLLEEGEGKVKVGDVIDHKGKKKKVVRIDGNRVFLQPVDNTGGGVEIDRQLGVGNSIEELSDISKKTSSEFDSYTDATAFARRLSKEDGDAYVHEVEETILKYYVNTEFDPETSIQSFKNGAPVPQMNESKKEESKVAKPELPLDVLHHGIRFELEKKGIEIPTEEEYLKAFKSASKNLEKDLLHYKKEEGAEDSPVSKSDEMVKVKLKEGFKNIIRKMLSEDKSKTRRPFNINGQLL